MFGSILMLLAALMWGFVWVRGLRSGMPPMHVLAPLLLSGLALVDATLHFKKWRGRRRGLWRGNVLVRIRSAGGGGCGSGGSAPPVFSPALPRCARDSRPIIYSITVNEGLARTDGSAGNDGRTKPLGDKR